jgi:hypothetical protein
LHGQALVLGAERGEFTRYVVVHIDGPGSLASRAYSPIPYGSSGYKVLEKTSTATLFTQLSHVPLPSAFVGNNLIVHVIGAEICKPLSP